MENYRSNSVIRSKASSKQMDNGAISVDNHDSIDDKIDLNIRPLSVSWIEDNRSKKEPSRLNVNYIF